MPEYRDGSLYVVETARTGNEIQQALKKIDDRLFLEQQIAVSDQKPVWCVVCAVGGDIPPITLLEWRDDDNNPLELSYGVVGRMERMERDGARLSARVIEQNRQRKMQADAMHATIWNEIGRDADKRLSPGYSAVLPRSQKLRMSRDKRRARGENV